MSRNHKRSWKNLLINKDYQLRMTIVLVGVSAVLVAGLGWWVMVKARTATEVAINNVEGTQCEVPAHLDGGVASRVVVDEITQMKSTDGDRPMGVDPTGDRDAGNANDEADPAPGVEPATDGAAKPARKQTGAESAADPRERTKPTITSSEMTLEPAEGTAAAALDEVDSDDRERQEKRYHECQLAKRAQVSNLRNGEKLIFRVLVILGLALVVGLAGYGIKMTHRVAGPLFKVTIYLRKLKEGTYEPVYDLRKGDQLLDFYEHFKAAFAGVRKMQEEDIERLRSVLSAAEKNGVADSSTEVANAIAELRALLDSKESSLG